MTTRTEIFPDGSCNPETGKGGWAAVILRTASGSLPCTSSNEMELRALVEAVKMAEGPCTIISDSAGITSLAQRRKVPEFNKPVWEELYQAIDGKDVMFEWRRRGQTFGQQLAHQLAREAVRGARMTDEPTLLRTAIRQYVSDLKILRRYPPSRSRDALAEGLLKRLEEAVEAVAETVAGVQT